VAEQTIDVVFRRLGRTPVLSKTAQTPLYGGETGPVSDYVTAQVARHKSALSPSLVQRLVDTYGSEYERVLAYMSDRDEEPLPDTFVLPAEVEHAARLELAERLSDVIFRRTDMAMAEPPTERAVRAAAETMADTLGWDAPRRRREIENTLEQLSSTETVTSAVRRAAAQAV
jgi:glycerol-3-phosphate dehydrogenase